MVQIANDKEQLIFNIEIVLYSLLSGNCVSNARFKFVHRPPNNHPINRVCRADTYSAVIVAIRKVVPQKSGSRTIDCTMN